MPGQPKTSKPISEDVAPAAVPDIENLVLKRMQSMRAVNELKNKDTIQALIAQAI